LTRDGKRGLVLAMARDELQMAKVGQGWIRGGLDGPGMDQRGFRLTSDGPERDLVDKG
jgi:hypothetical protein